MRSGRTLVSLAHELQRQLDTKKDLVVPSPLVRHSTSIFRNLCLLCVDDVHDNATLEHLCETDF